MVSGKVKGYISLSPTYLRLMGKVGAPLQRSIRIKPLNGHTFTVKEVLVKDGEHLQYELKPVKGDSDKNGYLLVVQNTMQTAGTYRDLITIKTDSKVKPILRIPVSARIHPATPQGQVKRQ